MHLTKIMTHNKISYLTAKLQEEAAEVIQAVSKINRFGEDNHHPDRQTTNKQGQYPRKGTSAPMGLIVRKFLLYLRFLPQA
jgi:hypothetical protein